MRKTAGWTSFLASLLFAAYAPAQTVTQVITTCGTPPVTLTAGSQATPLYIEAATGLLCSKSSSGTVTASPAAATTGGASNFHVIAAASDNHAVIKNGAGTVYSIEATNSGIVADYLRLYDAGTGFNGCNSATGVVWGGAIKATAAASGIGDGLFVSFPVGKAFATGIAICITGTGATPSDTDTAVAHTTTVVNVSYK